MVMATGKDAVIISICIVFQRSIYLINIAFINGKIFSSFIINQVLKWEKVFLEIMQGISRYNSATSAILLINVYRTLIILLPSTNMLV